MYSPESLRRGDGSRADAGMAIAASIALDVRWGPSKDWQSDSCPGRPIQHSAVPRDKKDPDGGLIDVLPKERLGGLIVAPVPRLDGGFQIAAYRFGPCLGLVEVL
jgi:hypothetical protein